MLSRALFAVSAVFATMALAAANATPYKLGMMSYNNVFDLAKRQAGYQPSTTPCGDGDTCAEACGPGSETCPSNDDNMYCFTPANQTCCPNLSGEACDDGYYCTQDSSDETWCCPNGMNLVTCAAVYSVSALQSLSGSATVPPASSATDIAQATTTDTILATTTDTNPGTTTTSSTLTASSTATVVVITTSTALAITTAPGIAVTAPTTSSTFAPFGTPIGTTGLGHTSSIPSTTIATFAGTANTHAACKLGSAVAIGLVGLIAAL